MPILYYVHDPMCSWCYAFAPTWERIRAGLPATLELEYVLGGLAPDTDQPMPAHVRHYIERTWRRIQAVVPGTEFNFAFWTSGTPKRSTYPACRAVLAAKHFDPALERPMIAAIQRAYYREARNPSELEVLCELGAELGCAARAFRDRLTSAACNLELTEHITKTRELGIAGFPSLVLHIDGAVVSISQSYADPSVSLRAIEERLAA